jgi:uncharacterized protein (DUF2141 family)
VRVVGARNKKGKIGVTLFQEAQGFPDDTSKAIRQQSVDIDPKYSERTDNLQGLPRGTFAVSVLHDENGNGKRDKNFMGIPKEGYGASKTRIRRIVSPLRRGQVCSEGAGTGHRNQADLLKRGRVPVGTWRIAVE